MTRPKRINLAGCVFHVICRADQDDVVFTEDKDKERFLEYLGEYAEQFDMRIHAYCLMDTHLHLLIETQKPNLSEFMRRLLTAYTVWFHKKHHTHGHLFAGRFKSLVVDKEEYLVEVSRYIHRNPVEADLVKKAEDFAWSSMRIYAGRMQSGLVHTREILHWFKNSREKYVRFVREGLESEIQSLILAQRFVGNEDFAKRVNIRLKREKKPLAMTKLERKAWRDEESWREGKVIADRYLKEICSKLGCGEEEFLRMRRKTVVYKKAVIQLIVYLRKESEWTFRQIGRYLRYEVKHVQKVFYSQKGKSK